MSKIGIIVGSGMHEMKGFKAVKEIEVKTPFGRPSDKLISGTLEGREVVFLPRHGMGHRIMPTEINCRANIYAMKKLGVDRIISISAVGSFKKEIKPLNLI